MPSPSESSCIYNLLNQSEKLPKVANRVKSRACFLKRKAGRRRYKEIEIPLK